MELGCSLESGTGLEELDADKLDQRAALLAHHWEKAGAGLVAARWHRRAAEWLSWRRAIDAEQHWRGVLTLLEGAPESSEADELALAAMSSLVSNLAIRISLEEVEGLRQDAKRLAEKAGDLQSLWRTEVGYGPLSRTPRSNVSSHGSREYHRDHGQGGGHS